MDLYKRNVIKSTEIIHTGKAVPLSGVVKTPPADSGKAKAPVEPAKSKSPSNAQKTAAASEIDVKKIQQEAYAKGYAEGSKAHQKEIAVKLEALVAATKAMPQIKKDILAKGEEQMLKLSIAIAEKILHQEVSTRKEIILDVIRGALKNVSETEGMKIRLNPQDFRYLMEVKRDFLQSFDGIRNIVFEEDAAIKRGGAIIETLFGEVDARLESQIKEIKTALLNMK